jgi:uncharacterized protein YrzB (UPF0473 family)
LANHEGHEHDEEMEQEEVVILEDEDGNEHEFMIAETFDVDSRIYAVLVSTDGSSDEGFIFRVEEKADEGEPYLDFIAIEDDAEWNEVERVYNSLIEEDEEEDPE